MRRILAIFLVFLKNWLRNRSALFFSFIFPLLLLLIFASIFTSERTQPITIFVQNQDQETQLSKVYESILNKTFNVEKIPSNISSPVNYLKTKKQGLITFKIRILIIPKGFEENATTLAMKEAIRLQILNLQRTLSSPYINESIKQEIIKGINVLQNVYSNLPNKTLNIKLITESEDTDYLLLNSILTQINGSFINNLIGVNATFSINHETVYERRISAVDYYLAGLLAAFVMTNGLFSTAPTLVEIRVKGILKRLLGTPLQKHEWFLGIIFSILLINSILLLEMLLAAVIIFKAKIGFNVYWILIFYIGMFFFIGLGVFIGSMVRSEETAIALVNLIGFPMMFLSGAFWPLEIMPDFLKYVAQVLPLYHFHTSLRYMVFGDTTPVINNILIVVVLSLSFTILSIKFLRWKET